MLVFFGTRFLLEGFPAHNLETPLDGLIPFVPEWITVYFLAYLVWIVGALLIVSENKETGYRFAAAYAVALLISCAVFLIWPGTMTRPEVTGNGIFREMVRFLYRVDTPSNLCPSLHVWISYLCFRGTFGCRGIPRGWKGFQLVFLILVCFSVLFVKQHVITDVPAGIVTGEISLQLARVFRLERIPFKIEGLLTKKK